MQFPLNFTLCILAFLWVVGCASEVTQPPAAASKSSIVDTTTSPSDNQTVASEQEPAYVVDPKAIEALETMAHHLRSLKDFRVHTQNSLDEILDYGQKIMVDSESIITVHGDDHLHVSHKNVQKDRDQQFFFDGQTFTIYGNKNKFYASFSSPGTISQMLEFAWNRFGLQLPLSDLFRWGLNDEDDKADVLAATYLGPAEVNGIACDHFAYRNDDVDWQIWIERGLKPIPLKLVITNTLDPTLPQYVSIMRWELNPKINRNMFTFKPTKDAHKIEFAMTKLVEEEDGGVEDETK